MPARRYRVFIWAGALALISWLTIAFLDPDPPGVLEAVPIGFFFGSMFANTTLAAAWAALGPGRLIWRVPLSLVWVLLLGIAIALNVAQHGGPRSAAFVVGMCLLGQWMLLQLPLWAIVLGFGIQLKHSDDIGAGRNQLRFGIGQLMIVTAVVGIVLGIGRVALGNLPVSRGETAIFAFLAVAAVVLTLPLLLAALMRRLALPGILLSLVFIGLATAGEFPLLQSFHSGPSPDLEHFIAINGFSATVILAFALVVRFNGYCLDARKGTSVS